MLPYSGGHFVFPRRATSSNPYCNSIFLIKKILPSVCKTLQIEESMFINCIALLLQLCVELHCSLYYNPLFIKDVWMMYRELQHDSSIYSHSIVAGGFDVTSYTIRLTLSTSLTIRTEIFSSTSQGIRAQSAVMPSIDVTARIPTV